jgi:hypothetical protein
MKKCYGIIIFLLGIITVLSIGKAVLQNTLSTSGIYVGKTEQEINSYKTQNAILSEELLAASSLINIAQKAEQTGFTAEKNLMVIKTAKSLAARP